MNDSIQTNPKSNVGVTLLPAALKHIRLALKKQPNSLGIRFSVTKTGCSGLAYVVDYVETINPTDKSFVVEDLTVYIDKSAYPYLKGMEVDYVQLGLNYKFTYQNPNQTAACGCGESFTVDARFSEK